MRILIFTPPTDEKILAREKVMTARLWRIQPPLVGDVVAAQTGRKKTTRFALLRVVKVKKWDADAAFDPTDESVILSEAVARKEGFRSVDEFQQAYFEHNKHNWDDPKRTHWFIEFEVIGDD